MRLTVPGPTGASAPWLTVTVHFVTGADVVLADELLPSTSAGVDATAAYPYARICVSPAQGGEGEAALAARRRAKN